MTLQTPACSESLAFRLQGKGEAPALVFLHGLLGSQSDWQAVVDTMAEDHLCLTLDLPGHGGSRHVSVAGFDDTCQRLVDTIQQTIDRPFWLVGYSLGARLAMYLTAYAAERFKGSPAPLAGLIVESGHPGLAEGERAARWANDNHWACRFESEPIVDVLQDWYQQAVFSSLNHAQRQSLVAARSANLGDQVASMLRATSLSRQENLIAPLQRSGVDVHYLCGNKDPKFRALAAQSGFAFHCVPEAGHNIHAEQPALFCQLLKQLIDPEQQTN